MPAVATARNSPSQLAEAELRQIPMQMALFAVLVSAEHHALLSAHAGRLAAQLGFAVQAAAARQTGPLGQKVASTHL